MIVQQPSEETEKANSFEENFENADLDTHKWMTRYFWGEQGMDASFVLEGEWRVLRWCS